jgi:hypothetical protein
VTVNALIERLPRLNFREPFTFRARCLRRSPSHDSGRYRLLRVRIAFSLTWRSRGTRRSSRRQFHTESPGRQTPRIGGPKVPAWHRVPPSTRASRPHVMGLLPSTSTTSAASARVAGESSKMGPKSLGRAGVDSALSVAKSRLNGKCNPDSPSWPRAGRIRVGRGQSMSGLRFVSFWDPQIEPVGRWLRDLPFPRRAGRA